MKKYTFTKCLKLQTLIYPSFNAGFSRYIRKMASLDAARVLFTNCQKIKNKGDF